MLTLTSYRPVMQAYTNGTYALIALLGVLLRVPWADGPDCSATE